MKIIDTYNMASCEEWIEYCEDRPTQEQTKKLVKKVNEDTHCKAPIELIEFMFTCMGINKTYNEYRKMTEEEKESFKRDIKIKAILK